jgi:two-component system, chemotaxis family, CheB/CheR fusion protein
LPDVIETLEARERKVRDDQGVEYSLRIHPYRNAENKIDGAVVTLVELSEKSADARGKKRKNP